MIKPFAIDPKYQALPNPFPSAGELRKALEGRTRLEQEIFVRLWLAEGVPYAFRNCPAIFEVIRGWLGKRLDVHPKEITLIGSARIGYSLAGGSEFGREFNKSSDLDFSIISPSLFDRLVRASDLFLKDYENGYIRPKNNHQKQLWEENFKFAERNIRKGFLDSKKIPNYKRYSAAQIINDSMWRLKKNLEITSEAPKVRDASVRVYRDWKSFVNQVSLNLCRVMSNLG